MPLDRNAGGHRFDDGEKCAKCEMTREQWDDTQKRCTGRPDAKPEALSTDELLDVVDGTRTEMPFNVCWQLSGDSFRRGDAAR